jgi:hypothetical protein
MLVIETRFMHEEWSVWLYFTKLSSYVLRISPVQRLTLSICKRILYSSSRVIFKILFNIFTLTVLGFPRGTSQFRFLIKIVYILFIFFVSSTRLARVVFLYFIALHGKEYALRILIMQYWHSKKSYVQSLRTCDVAKCVEILILPSLNNPGFICFKQLCLFVPQKSVREPKYLGFFQVVKIRHFRQFARTFLLPAVGENIYSRSTAIKRLLTGRNRRGIGRCVDW